MNSQNEKEKKKDKDKDKGKDKKKKKSSDEETGGCGFCKWIIFSTLMMLRMLWSVMQGSMYNAPEHWPHPWR